MTSQFVKGFSVISRSFGWPKSAGAGGGCRLRALGFPEGDQRRGGTAFADGSVAEMMKDLFVIHIANVGIAML